MASVARELAPKFFAPPFPKAVKGLDCASEAYLLSQMMQAKPAQNLVRITPDLKSGITLKQNLEFFLGESLQDRVVWFPPHDTLPYTGMFSGSDISAERIAALARLQSGEPFILVAPWPALLRKTLPPSVLKRHQWTLFLKEEIGREKLIGWLVDAGYRREVVVESPGDFAVRGGLVDVFSPQENYPARLEFDGDVLAQIRFFDPATQTTIRTVDRGPGTVDQKQITLIPTSEILFGEEFCRRALKQLKKFGDDLELPATVRREAAEQIEEKKSFSGMETFLPAFYETPASLFDYLKEDAIVFLPDPLGLKEATGKIFKEAKGLFESTQSVERLIHPEILFHSFEALEKLSAAFPSIFIDPVLSQPALQMETDTVHIENSEALKKKWSPEQLKKWFEQRLEIRLVCHTPIQAERLTDWLRTHGAPSVAIEVGPLSNGFCWMDEGLLVLTEEEIFGHKMMRRTRPSKPSVPFNSFAELKIGDTLVHEEHGINRYKGLVHLKTHGIQGDFLQLEFFGGDKLYLPVYRLGSVQRYIGGGGDRPPFLDKLGGVRWQKIKKRAGEQVYKIAQELLKIHAQRELHLGLAYPPPDTLDEEFASHFPYDETPDQSQAIADVLCDMQNSKPMDRLICGDVGYGKTEVAMRAAFKAVGAGKQVALLVPTTILALQHYETFQERFSKLAISVDMLSRFRSRAEQKATLAKLAAGNLDILIGTHRLLGRDVKFKDLGLLIVDEEHRFGVKHKEKIKKIRPTVDVLTLSATPIPRTLQMSMIGLRDLSTIHTPPVDRLAIRTFVAKWDEAIIRHAIEQELSRGGQVFFVHNRIATIGTVFKKLTDLFPKIKISVAHGQMEEAELEKVMIDFLHQRTQILLTTAIIESGIDVPGANTMVINRADTFGLAQLYQLRGRVGRSDRQAFCYLMIPDEEAITKEAKERLFVLTRYTELGAGFQIASHDLEIRGAGNLLGASQSGFIEEIGYELYTKLLAETIQRLKGEKVEETIDPEIHLKISAFIPENYVSDAALRMQLYKRMSHLSKEEEIAVFQEELSDRFGPLPEPVETLLEIVAIKQLAIQLRIRSVQFDGNAFALTWDPSTPVKPEILIRLAQQSPNIYRLKPSGVLFVKAPSLKTPEAILSETKNVLREMLKKTMDRGPWTMD